MMNTPFRTTLVVDDELAIHEMYDIFLRPDPEPSRFQEGSALADPPPAEETRNFKVLHAAGGEEAISLAANQHQKGNPIQVAFIDLKMHPIDGVEVIKQMDKIDHRTKFVIATGFPNQAMEELIQSLGSIPIQILSKPFTPDQVHAIATELCQDWNTAYGTD